MPFYVAMFAAYFPPRRAPRGATVIRLKPPRMRAMPVSSDVCRAGVRPRCLRHRWRVAEKRARWRRCGVSGKDVDTACVACVHRLRRCRQRTTTARCRKECSRRACRASRLRQDRYRYVIVQHNVTSFMARCTCAVRSRLFMSDKRVRAYAVLMPAMRRRYARVRSIFRCASAALFACAHARAKVSRTSMP